MLVLLVLVALVRVVLVLVLVLVLLWWWWWWWWALQAGMFAEPGDARIRRYYCEMCGEPGVSRAQVEAALRSTVATFVDVCVQPERHGLR